MRRLVFVLSLLLLPVAASAQSLCDQPMPNGVTVNPTKMYVRVDNFNTTEVDGSFTISQFQLGYWLASDPTATNPVQGPSTLARSAFAPVAGDAGCYLVTLIPSIPTGQVLVGGIKAQRNANGAIPAAESPYSARSGSFGSVSAAPLAAPGQPKFRQ